MISPDIHMSSTVRVRSPDPDNNLKITFNDETTASYSKDYILGLSGMQLMLNYNPYFKDLVPASQEYIENHVTLTQNSKDQFDFALRLLLEKEPFYQIVSKEIFNNPYIFEHLRELLAFFEPENYEEAFNDIKDDQLIYMPLEIAKQIMNVYKTTESDGEPPLAVSIAQQIIFDCNFLSEEEAHDYFRRLTDLKSEMILTQNKIKSLEARLVRTSTGTENIFIINMVAQLQEQLALNRQRFQSLIDKINPSLFRCMEKQKLAEKENSPDPELRELAREAKQSLTQYRMNILHTLKKKGVNMSRQDLLEYLIGPKAYMLDYYDICTTSKGPCGVCDSFYPASNQDLIIPIRLCEETPEELEKFIPGI